MSRNNKKWAVKRGTARAARRAHMEEFNKGRQKDGDGGYLPNENPMVATKVGLLLRCAGPHGRIFWRGDRWQFGSKKRVRVRVGEIMK